VIERATRRILGKAYCCGCVGLRIAVDEERVLIGGSETGSKVYGGGGFSYSTFLVSHRNDSRQSPLPQFCYSVAKI
jgi:hypothetical protein